MSVLLLGWAVLAVALAGLWWLQRRTNNANTADPAWASSIVALAILQAAVGPGDPVRRTVVALLAGLWGTRLAWHLLRRGVLGGASEDGRYRTMRAEWGESAPRRFFWVYQGQAAVATLFALPLASAMRGGPLGAAAWFGVAIWAIAIAGESVADAQLARFRSRADSPGRVCDEGLWAWSRHPNYFFEWLHWWAYVWIGEGRLATWIGPGVMLVLLLRWTGIPWAEEQALRTRGEAYRAYMQVTSAFVPWPPRRRARGAR